MASDLQLIVGAFANEELKCVIALKAANLSFSLRKGPNKVPKLLIGENKSIATANAIVRYVSSVSGTLSFDDLAVDEWIEWEEFTLRKAVAKKVAKKAIRRAVAKKVVRKAATRKVAKKATGRKK